MSILADTSTIFRALATRKTVRVAGEYTLELARYELGNAILKEHKVFKTLTREEAGELAGEASRLLDNMTLLPVTDFEGVMRTAVDTGLSFYDASYLYTAKSMGLTLSTEEERLGRASRGLSLPTTSLEALKS